MMVLLIRKSSHENERCENNEEREEDEALVMAGAVRLGLEGGYDVVW